MKTLILNGSPRPEGNTMCLVRELTAGLPGECHILPCYTARIAPCTDCRSCRTQPGCAIHDEMQTMYPLLEQCDNLVLASPVYYASLTGRLLDVVSRFQQYDAAKRFRHAPVPIRPKKAAVILTCGSSGGVQTAFRAARIILQELGAAEIFPLISSCHTDTVPAQEDLTALRTVHHAADWFRADTDYVSHPTDY